jgi:hypothetical protein
MFTKKSGNHGFEDGRSKIIRACMLYSSPTGSTKDKVARCSCGKKLPKNTAQPIVFLFSVNFKDKFVLPKSSPIVGPVMLI